MADATRASTASEHSSRLTHVGTEPTPPQDLPDPEKFAATHSVELEAQPQLREEEPTRRSRWIYRVQRALPLDHPRVLRVWYYVRGPRPKVDLPGAYNVL